MPRGDKQEMVRGLTAHDCMVALGKRYTPPAFALLEQVANGTGYRVRRWADAVAMAIWPSRGLRIHGFEIKVTLGDWKRELENPQKSVAVQSYCDHWWVVAPGGLIPQADMPPTWGLLEVNQKLVAHVAIEAPLLEAKALDRSFVAALLRRHAESHEAIVKRECERARQEGAESGAGRIADLLKQSRETAAGLEERIRKFEAASGIRLTYEWDIPELGKAVEIVRRRHLNVVKDLERDAERYRIAAKQLEKDAKEIRAIMASTGQAAPEPPESEDEHASA